MLKCAWGGPIKKILRRARGRMGAELIAVDTNLGIHSSNISLYSPRLQGIELN